MSNQLASSNYNNGYDYSDDSDADDFMKTLESARYNRTGAYTTSFGNGVSVSDADSDAELFHALSSNRESDIPDFTDEKSLPPPPPPPVDGFDSDSDDTDDFDEYNSRRSALQSSARLVSPTNRIGNSAFKYDSETPSPSSSISTSRMNERVSSIYPLKTAKVTPEEVAYPYPASPPPPPALEDFDERLLTEARSAASGPSKEVSTKQPKQPKEHKESREPKESKSVSSSSLSKLDASPEGSGCRTFANSMYTSFDAASHQIELGLYCVKRVIAFVRKLVQLEEDRHKGIQKMLHHELSKAEKISQDGMSGVLQIFKNTKQLFGDVSEQHKNIAEAVTLKVLQPLSDFYEKTDSKLREIIAEEHKMSKEMATARSIVTKNQKECLKMHLYIRTVIEEKAAAAALQHDNDKSFFSKMKQQIKVAALADPRRLTEQLATQAKAYAEAVRVANERQQRYVTKDLPAIFDGLEKLEVQRITVLKDRLHKLHKIYVKVQSPLLEIVQQMETITGPLKYEEEIKGFLENYVYIHGEPNPSPSFNYLLPCSPEDLMNGKLEGTPNSVFKTTLQHIMTMQAQTYPNLKVPHILRLLIDSVRDLDGFSTEGIFRVSHQKDELAIMRKSIDSGEDKICTTSPHGPAALLKEWLRELSESLVPSDLYSDAVKIIKTSSMKDEDSVLRERTLEIFRRLDDVNRHVIKDIAVMCAEIASPKNQVTNRMTMDNLAIVFSPSFLRNPSEDPMDLLNNTKHEIRFTSLFLSAVAEENSTVSSKPNAAGSVSSSQPQAPVAPIAPSAPAAPLAPAVPREATPSNNFFQSAPPMSVSVSNSGQYPAVQPAQSTGCVSSSNPASPYASQGPSNSMPATPVNGSSFFTPAPAGNPFLTSSSVPSSPPTPTPSAMSVPMSTSVSSPSGGVTVPMRAAHAPPPSLPARPTSYSVSSRPPPPVPGAVSPDSSYSFANSPTNSGK